MEFEVEEFYKRESISWLQEYIGFLFQTKCQMAAKTAIIIAKMKDRP